MLSAPTSEITSAAGAHLTTQGVFAVQIHLQLPHSCPVLSPLRLHLCVIGFAATAAVHLHARKRLCIFGEQLPNGI